MRYPQRDSQEKPHEDGPRGYIGIICFAVSMVIIWLVWPGLPDWAPPTLSMVIGITCWLAYRSLRRRKSKTSG